MLPSLPPPGLPALHASPRSLRVTLGTPTDRRLLHLLLLLRCRFKRDEENGEPSVPTHLEMIFTSIFAILSGPTIPIIGEGDEEANDRHVEQLVASAEAATEEVIRRGVAHPNNIAVGGHSYGAFMTANLLAHAPHFFAVALPVPEPTTGLLLLLAFRMRIEHWEATSTYIEMSPFLSANKIKKPILLVHGEEDNNSGTLTMRSDLFFNALKGHGALCHLVILPFESHGYSARESIMHVLWETDMWLQKYCVNNSNEAIDHSSKDDNNSSERSIASAAVGAPDCENLHEDGFHHVSFVIRLEHFTLIGQVLNLSRSYNFRPYLRGPSSQVNLRSEVAPVAT